MDESGKGLKMKKGKKGFYVVIEKDEDGYFVAEVPQLAGCHTQAKSLDELMTRAEEVVSLCLEANKRDGVSLYEKALVTTQKPC